MAGRSNRAIGGSWTGGRGSSSTGASCLGLPRPRPGTGLRGAAVASRIGTIPASPNSRRADRCVTSTAISVPTKSSSSPVAHLIDMPIAPASVVAEITGVAANTSTAMAARELRRRPPVLPRAVSQPRSRHRSISKKSVASLATAFRKAAIQSARPCGVSALRARGPVSGTGARRRRLLVQKRTRAPRTGGRVRPESSQDQSASPTPTSPAAPAR